jgi:hypothetical protein
VDQLVERILFSNQNAVDIRSFAQIPSKPGFGMLDADAVDALRQNVEDMKGLDVPLVSTDMSNWDFTFQEWEWKAEYKLRAILAGAKMWDAWAGMSAVRIYALSMSVFALSDGSLFAQRIPGIMKSGSYLTSSTNSRIRAFGAHIRRSPSITMGDDCVENGRVLQELVEHYAHIGHCVKDARFCEDGKFEFCSHVITDNYIVPINWLKMVVNFIVRGEYDELSFQQLVTELKDADHEMIEEILARNGVHCDLSSYVRG